MRRFMDTVHEESSRALPGQDTETKVSATSIPETTPLLVGED